MNEHEFHHHQHMRREAHGRDRRQQQDGDQDNREGMIYGASFGNIGIGASVTVPLQIDALNFFELEQIQGYGEPNGAATPVLDGWISQATLQIVDGAENRSMFNIPLPFGMVCGTARLPFVLAKSRVFKPNQSVNLTVVNFGGVIINNAFVALVGAHIPLRSGR